MDTDEVTQKIKDFFSRSAKASKEAFEKAGDKVQEFSDKSVIRLEKKQLENKLDAKYLEMGKKISEVLEVEALRFNMAEDEDLFKTYMEAVENLKEQIAEKENLLK